MWGWRCPKLFFKNHLRIRIIPLSFFKPITKCQGIIDIIEIGHLQTKSDHLESPKNIMSNELLKCHMKTFHNNYNRNNTNEETISPCRKYLSILISPVTYSLTNIKVREESRPALIQYHHLDPKLIL